MAEIAASIATGIPSPGTVVVQEAKALGGAVRYIASTGSAKAVGASAADVCGGAYSKLKNLPKLTERHHMSPNAVLKSYKGPGDKLTASNGAAIRMEIHDHGQTASHGHKPGAAAYRAMQEKLLEQGRYNEAFDNDVADIRFNFGSKYDDAISQAKQYAIEKGWYR